MSTAWSRYLLPVLTICFTFTFMAPAAYADLYFPQIAAGGGYTTVVTLMHTDARSTTAANGRLRFFNPNGTARTVTTAEFGTGSEFAVTLPSQGTRIVTITSTGDVSIGTAIYEIAGVSVGGVARFTFGGSSVGVLNARPTATGYVPLVTKSGFDNGVALQNPSGTAVNIRLRLIKPDGTVDQTSSPSELNPFPAFGQYSKLVTEMGFSRPVQANSVLEVAVQGAGSVAILPLVIGNNYISSSSLVDLTQSEMPLFFAQIVDGGGYTTSIRLFNPYGVTAKGFLKFYTTAGNPRQLPFAGMGSTSAIPISIPAGQTAVYETTGESAGVSVGIARLDASTPLGGLATLFFGQTHVGVASSPPMRSGRIPVDTNGGDTGVALASFGPGNVNLRLTLQDREGANPLSVLPTEINPLRPHSQYARYVTQMGFSSSANLKDSSLLVEPVGAGTFLSLALLDRGAFSSTATSRQRLYNPQQFVGNFTGTWNMPDFGSTFGGGLTVSITVDSNNNATVKTTITGNPGTFVGGTDGPPGTATGTFDANGDLVINGLINMRLRADGAFTIFLGVIPGSINTPTGVASWFAFNGELTGSRLAGAVTLGQQDGSMIAGTFNLSK